MTLTTVLYLACSLITFFFFQAEDGIRDLTVTGVQTCALPISLFVIPAAAQTTRHVLKGDSVAVYNLVGELRVEAGSGSDVVVDLQRGGTDAAKLQVESGPLRGRETLRVIYPDDVIVMPDWGRGGGGWNTTLRVRDDGTFGDDGWDEGRGRGHGRFRDREGHEVRITGRSRDGLEAYADLRISVQIGRASCRERV